MGILEADTGTTTEGMMQYQERQDTEGRSEVKVSNFSEFYPETPSPARGIFLKDIGPEITVEIHRTRTAALPQALAHYANELRPVLTPDAFKELVALTEEADSVAYDADKLTDVRKKAAFFFGQLELNKP
jgi:hypothetical protein